MRALLCALLLAPLLATAQAQRSTARLVLTGKDALHRVALPYEAYRDGRADLADVRVLNAAGEPVPIAWAGGPKAAQDEPTRIALPMFPVSRVPAPGRVVAGSEITISASDGTLVAVKPRGAAMKPPPSRPSAYVLDASQVKEPMRALVLDWKAGPGTEVVTVSVEASDDLKSWSHVASAPVVRIEHEGSTLAQPRVEFPARRARYLRVAGQSPDFALAGVRAELEPAVRAPARAIHKASGGATGKPGEIAYDAGARLPVRALRLVPAEANAVLAVNIFTRDHPNLEWRRLTTAAFYRLKREQGEVESAPLEIGSHAARYWLVRLVPGSSGGAVPTLELHWHPAQLVFVAQGSPPYALAFGDSEARPAMLPIRNLIPDYEPLAEMGLPEARAGAVDTGPPPTRWQVFVRKLDAKRVILWSLLIAGVAVLGYMSWRLMRRM